MKRWKLMFAVMMMVTVFVLSACGGGSSLVGRWEESNFGDIEYEFFSDGTLLVHQGARRPWSGTWTAEGGTLVTDMGGHVRVRYYSISGNTLTLESTIPGGPVERFQRIR